MKSSSHKKKIHRRSRNHPKTKSKKRRRDADDSLSLSDSVHGDSRSVSSSSSDSEGELWSGRRRGGRGDPKSSRKRARRSASRGDDLKKKRKKKGHIAIDARKKKPVKKKRRNTRSVSRDSHRSCSTCGGRSSSSGDREVDRSRKQDKSKLGGRGRRRYRSRSYSPSSCGCSKSRSPSEERLAEESFPKRLGSVITVVKQSNEAEKSDWNKDENKAEIIQAYDDFPSSRSNDSCEDGRKREGGTTLAVHGDHVLENKGQTDGSVSGNGVGIKCSQKDPVLCDFGSDPASVVKKSEDYKETGSSEVDEVELRLRIKALENFTKFRRGVYATSKSLVDKKDVSAVAEQSVSKADSIRKVEPAGVSADGKSASSVELRRDIRDGTYAHESNARLKMQSLSSAGSRMSIAGNAVGKPNKSTQLTSTFRRDSSGSSHFISDCVDHAKAGQVGDHTIIGNTSTCSKENPDILKQSPKIPESSDKLLLEKTLDRNVSEIPEATHGSKLSMQGLEVKNGDGSAPKTSSSRNPESGDCALKERKLEEAKDSSQYEQKTMSVMRGGEMVQVSYKVYIPKKPPALARRQLQR